jgi:16S rRNA (cytosine967-C5)-methyltransferase
MEKKWTARDVALEVLTRVERSLVHATTALDNKLVSITGLPAADRALITELVYGVLRHRRRLDRALAAWSRRELRSTHPFVLRVLRMGAYQVLLLDRVPARAAIDHAVRAVKRTLGAGPAGFVNAVLRNLDRRGEPPLPDPQNAPEAYLKAGLSFPDELAAQFIEQLGVRDAIALAAKLNERPRTVLRANTLKTSRADLVQKLKASASGVQAGPTALSPDGVWVMGLGDPVRHPLHEAGMYSVQEQGAQLISYLVAPQPKQRILDGCCGTGGKSLHLAALTANQARIVGCDASSRRLREARVRAAAAGACNIEWIKCDLSAESFAPKTADGDEMLFDAVLLDAPCSGLGALRRHPEAKWRFSLDQQEALVALQQRMLDNVAPRVVPGGVLVYAVCTFNAAEGSGQIASFLKRHAAFRPAPLPAAESPVDKLCTGPGRLALWPHTHETDGFFAARLVRGKGRGY